MTFHVPRALRVLLPLGFAALLVLLSPRVLAARATTRSLGGANRYLTHVTTDKPLYRPGEQVLARGLVLDALSRKPYAGSLQAQLEVRGPRGDIITTSRVATADAVWGYSWPIPAGQPGGEYTLRVTYPWTGAAPAERKFDVRAYRAPRLKSQIEFLRDGYGPGDTVTATLDVKRAEGGVPEGAKVMATALVDGATAAQVPCTVDGKGRCTVRFALPAAMERGEGTLAFTIEDGGVVESAAKTIPILLQTLDLTLYPEGGDLVAGLASRVYFEARTPARKPADLVGRVVEVGTGRVVARVRSEHEGRGRFELTPQAGVRYALRIDSPSGIQKSFPLPEVKPRGAVLGVREDVVPAGRMVQLAVGLSGVGRATVTLSQREVRVASAVLESAQGGPVTLDPGEADGVLVATVWDHDGRPLAERLVFRQPSKEVTVELKADRKRYVPGGPVQLTARTTRDGQPISALVMLTVTDDAVLELQEKRDQAPQLPVMVLLEPEVKELADAQLYLDAKNPKSKLAVDLLLGTQGWRRFALTDTQGFLARHGDAAMRVLAVRWPQEPVQRPRPSTRGGGRGDAFAGVKSAPGLAQPMGDAEVADDRAAGLAVGGVLPGMANGVAAAPAAPELRAQAPEAPAPDAPAAVAPEPVLQAKEEEAAVMGKIAQRAKRDMSFADKHALMGQMVYLREFAHTARPNRKTGDRVDFAETLYWNAGVRTDARTGEARVSFAMSDSVTTFKAFAGAVGGDGALGSAVAELESVQPFYAEPKLPLEVTSGDVVRLPVALVNGTEGRLAGAGVKVELKGDVKVTGGRALDLASQARARQLFSLEIGQEARPVDVKLTASAGEYTDVVTRTLSIKPRGFPGRVSFGGLLSAKGPAAHRVVLPQSVVPGSVRTSIAVYPGPLANMTESLARLIQEPSGCFEQTSSTTYPMTMAQQYFQTHTGVNPELVASAREKLERGYQRLVGYETSEKGYEWFGQNPGHEALTAFGLLHFTDMRQVREVDTAMLERTREWLLQQRDGQGGFNRKRRALHVWVEDADTSNAYILWTLLESAGQPASQAKELSREVASLKAAAAKSTNSYVVALAANAMALAGDTAEARALMGRLASLQGKDGVVGGATQSIVGSSGETLNIETTALATLAWMRDPSHVGNVERAMKFLAESSDGGRYGATQSTVLALRAIIAYDKARASKLTPGLVRVYVEGRPVGEPVRFDGSTQEALKLPDVSALLGPGERRVELRMEGGAELPYSVEVTYSALVPDSSKDTSVALEVTLAKTDLTEGEPTEARVVMINRTGQRLPTAVAIFGVPGGLEVRHDQLKELVKRQVVDAYEVLGRDVVLYWRGMEPRKRIDVPLSLVAAVPGTYTGPASRAYLYYADEHKTWNEGVKVSIAPKP
ncbi:MG2 domain-containing protein [Corallococcus llansteffanensis]|uniref:A-macroglobulin complement component n=1 Tax=Corallococcus llansteffanensis TaxID=2316731 RepID=A0A3A8QMG4_9BACT|nr:MG2 domain-containing protein [Corallococcus llansteffanensis]RKH69018.1 A-macroglobulin complement component [Corallococcus llansteffanensis]